MSPVKAKHVYLKLASIIIHARETKTTVIYDSRSMPAERAGHRETQFPKRSMTMLCRR